MSIINQITKDILKSIEVAAEIELPEQVTAEEQYIAFLQAQLNRSNIFLDKNKQDVFRDILDLNTKGQVERATTAYNKNYLLGLGISIDSTVELTENLIRIAKQFKVSVPQDWTSIVQYNIYNTQLNDSIRKVVKL